MNADNTIPEYDGESDRPWDSWKIIQERAQSCPILSHYCAAYRVFGSDARVSREIFLGDLVIALHDTMTKHREELLHLRQEMPRNQWGGTKVMSNFSGESADFAPYDERAVNIIRGKSMKLDKETGRDIRLLCRMLDWFEWKLDECDEQDMLGTEGWRHYFGIGD